MPAVSVIIPVYDVEPYMARCARSLFQQTLEDIEFLFMDDCSPDHSVALIRQIVETEFPERASQVRIFRMPVNSGQAAVRMKALEIATGQYVIHCDSDDYLSSADAYERMYEKALAEDLDIVTCNYEVERDGKVVDSYSGECTDVRQMLLGNARWSLFCQMVRKSLFDSGITAPVANMGEDMVLSVQARLKARRSGHIDCCFYRYCLRDDSIYNTPGEEALLARWKNLMNNTRLLVGLLQQTYGYSGEEPELVWYKYNSRCLIRPLVHHPECYRLWRSTYPEVDRKVLWMPVFSLEEKFWFLLIHLHLYHPVKCITGFIRRRNPSK